MLNLNNTWQTVVCSALKQCWGKWRPHCLQRGSWRHRWHNSSSSSSSSVGLSAPQLVHCVDECDDIATTPNNNVDNTILTYCTESYTLSYVICSVNALVNRPGGEGTYMSRFGSNREPFILLLSVVVIPSRRESYPRSTSKRIMSIQ